MLTPNGPGGRGSIPALVMRTGLIQPVDPKNARRDITTAHVEAITRYPTDEAIPPEFLPSPSAAPTVTSMAPMPSQAMTAVAQTTTATPPNPIQSAPNTLPPFNPSDRHHWHTQHRRPHPMMAEIKRLHPSFRGSTDNVQLGEWNGRPLAKFEIASSPPPAGVQQAAHALRQAAHVLQRTGLAASLPPELIAGPLAALLRGGAVELHFQNGAVVRAAL